MSFVFILIFRFRFRFYNNFGRAQNISFSFLYTLLFRYQQPGQCIHNFKFLENNLSPYLQPEEIIFYG